MTIIDTEKHIPADVHRELDKIITNMGLTWPHAIADGIFCLDYITKLCKLLNFGDFYNESVQDEIYTALLEYRNNHED